MGPRPAVAITDYARTAINRTQARSVVTLGYPQFLPPLDSDLTAIGLLGALAFAGAGGTVIVWIVEQFLPQPIPGQVVGALVTLGTVGVGFFFSGGRSNDTV